MYTLKVVDIIDETYDTVTLCFKQPTFKKIHYLPGQYLTLLFRINGRRYIRPYSFSSSPSVDQFIEITVKRVQGGIVSNHIIDTIKIGDSIEVLPPMGHFVYKSEWLESDTNIILWGAGSGITPLFSILKYILLNSSTNKVILFYGNQQLASTIFHNKIEALMKQYANQFTALYFYTSLQLSDSRPNLIQGRIHPQKVLSILSKIDINNSLHYICGPVGLKESVKQYLYTSDVSENKIFSEDFENIKNPKDFDDVYTQTISIDFNGASYKVEVTKGKSILEAGLDALIDLPYSCQTGDCTLCKAKIISGNIKLIGLEIIPDTMGDDECLMCCSYPLSNDINLKVE